MPHKNDTDEKVCFYENEFYVLSNFSSFVLEWKDTIFYTSEAAYQWEKFPDYFSIRSLIQTSYSAHDAYQYAAANRAFRRHDWDAVKTSIMTLILAEKAKQHEYVYRKLMETGDRLLVEDSWRDDFWGIGPMGYGQNMLGKLWMNLRNHYLRYPLSHKKLDYVVKV